MVLGDTPKRSSIRNSQVAGLTADAIKEIVATCMHSTTEREDKLAAAITKALQSKESSRKRSNSDAEPWIREEGPEMVKIDRPIRYDAHTTIDWDLRTKLRPINLEPSKMYDGTPRSKISKPVLGGSLQIKHMIPGYINESSIKKVINEIINVC